jgi:DNA-binding MarR family transcriptional regulator
VPGPRRSRARVSTPRSSSSAASLSLLTNHARVLIAAAASPDARVRDLAASTDLSERGVLRILADLESAGYLERVRVGRCTRYEIDSRRGLDDRVGRPIRVADLVGLARGSARR